MMTKITAALVLVLILIAGLWGWNGYGFTQKAGDFEIKEGDSGRAISLNLEKEGFIKNAFLYRVFLKFYISPPNFQAGTYNIRSRMAFGELTRELTKIKIAEITVTIPEGWDLYDIAGYLEKNNLIAEKDFYNATGKPLTDYRLMLGDSSKINWSGEFSFLAESPPYVSLEGFLFPDTYRFFQNFTAADLTRKMLRNFSKKISPLEADIRASGKSVFEIITLASIVENEVRTPKNRAMVADIFWRRLRLGIPLQSDATVNYITRKNMASPTFDDTKIDSPYNTYKYKGLPLGPISNPGLASINAVLHPESNPYLYFLTTPDGDIFYAKTYEEHLANKRKYLK